MSEVDLLENLAAKVLGISKDSPADEINSVTKEKKKEFHPDLKDERDTTEDFKAVNTAGDILTGEFDFTDSDKVRTAKEVMERVLAQSEIDDAKPTKKRSGYKGEATSRRDPGSYNIEDISTMSKENREAMIKKVALGIETNILYEGVSSLYEQGYDKDSFFNDVNSYISEYEGETIAFGDYYEATEQSLRDDVTKSLFIDSAERVQDELQNEYGEGATLGEIARIISYFMIQGGIDLGYGERFVGDDRFGRDDRFSSGGRGDSRFGRDSRFDR